MAHSLACILWKKNIFAFGLQYEEQKFHLKYCQVYLSLIFLLPISTKEFRIILIVLAPFILSTQQHYGVRKEKGFSVVFQVVTQWTS